MKIRAELINTKPTHKVWTDLQKGSCFKFKVQHTGMFFMVVGVGGDKYHTELGEGLLYSNDLNREIIELDPINPFQFKPKQGEV